MGRAEAEERPSKKPPGFRVFGGTFTFRLIPTLIALLMLVVLIGLGGWQIERLHWKENLINEMQSRMQEPAIDVGLSVIPPEDIPNMDYHPGSASGLLQNDKMLYLNATAVSNGDGGYDVLVPLVLDDGRVLLVNRGWMPYGLKDKPENDDPEQSLYRPAGPVQITGILRLPPDKKPSYRPDNDPGKNDWYWIDLTAMAQATDVKEFLPYVLEAIDVPHDGSWPVGGQTRISLPNNHLNYAITWFALALILPVIYFMSGWRREARKKPEGSEKSDDAKAD